MATTMIRQGFDGIIPVKLSPKWPIMCWGGR